MKTENINWTSTFNGRVIRSLPVTLAASFCIAVVGLVLSALTRGREIKWLTIVLAALAFSFVWSGVMGPVVGYNMRRSEGIAKGSPLVKRMFLLSLLWSVSLCGLGFFLLGCSGIAGSSCWSALNLEISATAAVVMGAFLSLIVLSS
ncbi:hypothetical protein [Steroidobacter agaridevorans]|uniref:hypothetical protein n=1 Tax=Steroidobacter agaridevorans TaxID=2695856 RepID=UPI001326036E|nr:hypothetical protein [Steroidobacter agaridevorans]GFE85721.1 hypothetical protein GCM10011488_06750 [Steroidobacter agaridevorans]